MLYGTSFSQDQTKKVNELIKASNEILVFASEYAEHLNGLTEKIYYKSPTKSTWQYLQKEGELKDFNITAEDMFLKLDYHQGDDHFVYYYPLSDINKIYQQIKRDRIILRIIFKQSR
jgi:hypothetical protein